VKPLSDRPFTARVGIDWADAKHDVCLQAADSEQREFDRFAHQVGSIDQWAKSLHQRFGGPIAVALELAKGPIVYALQKYDFLVLFPINPATLAKYREAFKPSAPRTIPPMPNSRSIYCSATRSDSNHSSRKVWRCARCSA
jgi:hypothetical protein